MICTYIPVYFSWSCRACYCWAQRHSRPLLIIGACFARVKRCGDVRLRPLFTIRVVHIIYGELGANLFGSFGGHWFWISAVSLVRVVCTTPIHTYFCRGVLSSNAVGKAVTRLAVCTRPMQDTPSIGWKNLASYSSRSFDGLRIRSQLWLRSSRIF